MSISDFTRRLRALQREYEVLGETLRALANGAPLEDYRAPAALGLDAAEERMLGVLLRGELISNATLLRACQRPGRRMIPSPSLVKAQVCKLRKKLAPYGVEITTVHSSGYLITKPMCERFDAAFAVEQAA